jgi:uncharacterized phiE125 gp8 family phage protein
VIRYGVKKLTSSSFAVATVEQARNQCNVSHREDDSFLKAAIAAAGQYIERQLECSIGASAYTITLDRFPVGSAPLPLPIWPIAEITAIRYVDSENEEQTLSLSTIATPANDGRTAMARKNWEPWPTTKRTPNAVEVDVTAGWSNANAIPAPLVQCALMLVAHWYLNRESVTIGHVSREMEFSVNALLDCMRPGDDITSDQLGGDYEYESW